MKIWQRMSLRVRVYMILASLLFIIMAGGLVAAWYTYQMDHLLASVTEKNLAAFQTAEAMEIALINQKGFVSYYFIDGDPEWLRQLSEFRQIFVERLNEALNSAEIPHEKQALHQIKIEYTRYSAIKDSVIAHYQEGKREAGIALHRQVRELFFTVLEYCQNYKDIHAERILQAKSAIRIKAANLRFIAITAVCTGVLLAALLAFVLRYQILGPVRRLTAEACRKEDNPAVGNEVKALSHSVRGLIQNVNQTQSELEKSRESLLQAEKMAIVGKLAAGMAHSIRNPFTSVKMRLFSLNRSLELTGNQKDDFEVISEEIRHIDTIIQNFLEFSRPPKLKIQTFSPSVVVDRVIQLLEHRLKSYNVRVQIKRDQMLPAIDADPEQLKELLVNIVVNACEAMTGGGSIVIREEVKPIRFNVRQAIIRVSDNGPGMPESIQKKIFQPFFTTKEEGTGLGLSIASRIIKDHNGRLDVESRQGEGAMFIVRLPGMSGLETFQAIQEFEPKLPVIIMTAYATTANAIEATKMGAFDYILKPFEIPDMLTVVEQALETSRFMRTPVELDVTPDKASGEAIIGHSKPMQEVYKAIGRVSQSEATVLIRGESGTGKELVARAIYQHSLRTERPFLVINCVAIPENLLESELFGYEKGAFTGATQSRVGKIEQANGGTVFLDEIGDMPFSIQAKLLRLLQEKSIERLGGRDTIPVDVRIIAATNRDLEAALADGRFRDDLYYRLKVVTIYLPPLRERLSDIPLLTKYFLSHFSHDLDMNNPGITEDAISALNQHHWPGNVRELANILQKALIFNRGAPISTEDISQALRGESVVRGPEPDGTDQTIRQWVRYMMTTDKHKNRFDAIMNLFGSIIISEALNLTDGNRTRAAQLLGLSRPTLHSKIDKYGLKLETTVKTE